MPNRLRRGWSSCAARASMSRRRTSSIPRTRSASRWRVAGGCARQCERAGSDTREGPAVGREHRGGPRRQCERSLVADGWFSIAMGIDATYKDRGRMAMREICVYQVRDGKIVREQFFYERRRGRRCCPLPPSAPSPASRGKGKQLSRRVWNSCCRFPCEAGEAAPKGLKGALLILLEASRSRSKACPLPPSAPRIESGAGSSPAARGKGKASLELVRSGGSCPEANLP